MSRRNDRDPETTRGEAPSWDDTITSIRPEHRDVFPTLVVEVVRGASRGKTVALPVREIVVGSGPACDLVVEDRTVSRRHVEIRPHVGQAVVRDLGSHNGTVVRGVRIAEATIPLGAEVVIGDSSVVVRKGDPQQAAIAASESDHFGRLFGGSLAMRQLYPLLERLAISDVTVLIEGETGTGKEVVAEALHEQGPRRDGPFVVFDCSAVPANLMESELFGHERGAFTGATGTRKGLFEMASGGTLFIDELGELEPALQPKLLRAIERREIRRVGGSQTIRVDARIVAATRRDLDHEVQVGRFRDDLYHRFAIARVRLPPLRLRDGDVSLLARRFAEQLAPRGYAIPENVLARFEDFAWPGNVRELRNAVLRLVAVGTADLSDDAKGPRAGATDEGSSFADIVARGLPYPLARDTALERFNERYVEEMLKRHGGNVSRAAEASGIARRYFQQLKARSK